VETAQVMDLPYDRARALGSLFDCTGTRSSEVFHKPHFHSADTRNEQPLLGFVSARIAENACKLDFKVDQFARHRCFSDSKSAELPKIRANGKTKRAKLPKFGPAELQENAPGWQFESFCFLVGMKPSMIRTFWILETTDHPMIGTFWNPKRAHF
jgi:hypothetical protein